METRELLALVATISAPQRAMKYTSTKNIRQSVDVGDFDASPPPYLFKLLGVLCLLHDQHNPLKRIGSISDTPDVSDLDVGINVAFISYAIMISIVL